MRLFICKSHTGHYLPGVSIVFADNETEARRLLDDEIRNQGLEPNDYELEESHTEIKQAIILFNGDY